MCVNEEILEMDNITLDRYVAFGYTEIDPEDYDESGLECAFCNYKTTNLYKCGDSCYCVLCLRTYGINVHRNNYPNRYQNWYILYSICNIANVILSEILQLRREVRMLAKQVSGNS